jgi:hypothetical protein
MVLVFNLAQTFMKGARAANVASSVSTSLGVTLIILGLVGVVLSGCNDLSLLTVTSEERSAQYRGTFEVSSHVSPRVAPDEGRGGQL